MKEFRVLDAEDTVRSLPMNVCIDAMRIAFGDERVTPLRTTLGPSLIMPGSVQGGIGVKVIAPGPQGGVGLVTVFDDQGRPVGAVDGPAVSAIRTGAATGLATDLLAPGTASSLAMLGAGAMAYHQIEAIRAVRPINRVAVWSQTFQTADEFGQKVHAEAVKTITEAVRDAEIIVTATPSKSPLFSAAEVMPGVHVNAIGSYRPDMAEVPPGMLEGAFVVVDDYAAAQEGAGDLIQAGVTPDAEISDLIMSRVVKPDGVATVFKSVGIASQDVAAAFAALERAEEEGRGTVV